MIPPSRLFQTRIPPPVYAIFTAAHGPLKSWRHERVRLDIERTRIGFGRVSVLSWGGIVPVRLGVAALGSPLCLLIVLALVRVLIVAQTAPEEASRSIVGSVARAVDD